MLRTVHPHVCGEHITIQSHCCSVAGSSPRVWGTYPFAECHLLNIRFIPTCVGNISDDFQESGFVAVHPHVCGEHLGSTALSFSTAGSSPRVWGTCPRPFLPAVSARFIPTCVGNMSLVYSGCDRRSVHPHVCGEHLINSTKPLHRGGSSPRVWGT